MSESHAGKCIRVTVSGKEFPLVPPSRILWRGRRWLRGRLINCGCRPQQMSGAVGLRYDRAGSPGRWHCHRCNLSTRSSIDANPSSCALAAHDSKFRQWTPSIQPGYSRKSNFYSQPAEPEELPLLLELEIEKPCGVWSAKTLIAKKNHGDSPVEARLPEQPRATLLHDAEKRRIVCQDLLSIRHRPDDGKERDDLQKELGPLRMPDVDRPMGQQKLPHVSRLRHD